MGLDSVELVMKIEKTFNISIPDQEAETIRTVVDMHQIVWNNLNAKHGTICKSQHLFYKLRQSFITNFKISSQHFTLDAPINNLFPTKNRRQEYMHFANTTNLKLPDLVLTKQWAALLDFFGVTTILGGFIYSLVLINAFDYTKWTLLIPVAGIFTTIFVSKILEPKRTLIDTATVREFTQTTLYENYGTLAQEIGATREEVETIINQIIVDTLGVKPEEVIPGAKFVDDLGID